MNHKTIWKDAFDRGWWKVRPNNAWMELLERSHQSPPAGAQTAIPGVTDRVAEVTSQAVQHGAHVAHKAAEALPHF